MRSPSETCPYEYGISPSRRDGPRAAPNDSPSPSAIPDLIGIRSLLVLSLHLSHAITAKTGSPIRLGTSTGNDQYRGGVGSIHAKEMTVGPDSVNE